MRLFVAAEVGERLAGRIGAVIDDLRARVVASAPRAKVTWMAADRVHVTVRFIGEVDAARVEPMRAALRLPLAVGAFDLRLAGVGAFPKGGSPRVLWVGVADGFESLKHVEQHVSARLASMGVPEESRPYSPHLTVARVREAAGLKTATLLEGLVDVPLGVAHIDAITLFQSRLSPKGPTYLPLERIPLT